MLFQVEQFYEFNPSGIVNVISEEEFKQSKRNKVLLHGDRVSIGKFKGLELEHFGVSLKIGKELEIISGTWNQSSLIKGIQLFPKNMTIIYRDNSSPEKSENENILVTIDNLDDNELVMKCQPTKRIQTNCHSNQGGRFNGPYHFDSQGYYNGQLDNDRGPTRNGFGSLTNHINGFSHVGYWSQNETDIFGAYRDPMDELYAGQFYEGHKLGAGASISLSKKHRTILVSDHIFGQKNGPGVFLYPEAERLVFFGVFRKGKKQGEGVWMNLDNREVTIR